jgi:hypothetical protein
MPVILATQEAEIRRIMGQSQPGQIVCETLSPKYPSQKKGWWSGSRCRPRVQTPVVKKRKKKGRPSFWGQPEWSFQAQLCKEPALGAKDHVPSLDLSFSIRGGWTKDARSSMACPLVYA